MHISTQRIHPWYGVAMMWYQGVPLVIVSKPILVPVKHAQDETEVGDASYH